MNNYRKFVVSVLAMGAMPALAADFKPLSQACEESLALSALPGVLRDQASVYVWRGKEFEKTVSFEGGFHCLVQRNHPDAIIPECVSASGKDSILQGIMFKTKKAALGFGPEEVEELAVKAISDGTLKAPTAPGVNYMLSAYNRIYTSRSDAIAHVPPHSMFFAPNAKNAEVGGSLNMAMENHGYPFVVEEGAHSYMITFTNNGAESDDVDMNCRGQIELNEAS